MTKRGFKADENWLRGAELRSKVLLAFWGFSLWSWEVMELTRLFLGEVTGLHGRAIDGPKPLLRVKRQKLLVLAISFSDHLTCL